MILSFLKRNWFAVSLILIGLTAVLIRFYQLGTIPHGMTWDEAAIGYNGYAVLHSRRDEWLERLPISFKSFGDYKAPLAIYANGFSTFLFGMNLFAVRLPFTVASILTIAGFGWLIYLVFKDNPLQKYYTVFAVFLLSLSPWHIHYSRAGFESGMALFFVMFGIVFGVLSVQSNLKNKWALAGSILAFVLSVYTYHSAKLVVPLLLLVTFSLFFKTFTTKWKVSLLAAIGFAVGLIPFLKDSLYGEGLTRAGVTIFSQDLPLTEQLLYVGKSFIAHLSPSFLLYSETTTLRHTTGYMDVLYGTTLVLVILGLVRYLIGYKRDKYQALFLSLILIGILPASIALEVPHSNRALLALPGFLAMAVYGLEYAVHVLQSSKLNKELRGSHNEKNGLVKAAFGSLLLIHIICSVAFLHHYFFTYSKTATAAFNDGYIEAYKIAHEYETSENSVDKIKFTSDYGQPVIYALFVRETLPIFYHGGSLSRYQFLDEINAGDLNENNALIVGSNTDELPIEKADHVIYGADGSVRFVIFRTERTE